MKTTSVETATVRRMEATRRVRELGMHGNVAPVPERSLRIGKEMPKRSPREERSLIGDQASTAATSSGEHRTMPSIL